MMRIFDMFGREKKLVTHDSKTNEYRFNVSEEELAPFYEALFNFFFEDNDTRKLDNFLEVSQHRLEEFVNQNFYDETD